MSAPDVLRIATRASRLALWQSEHVASRLRLLNAGLKVEIVAITTTGDRIVDQPLAKIGGKGLFVKELEVALLEGDADIAVHSMKDVPAEFPPGLDIVAIMAREDARDVLLSSAGSELSALAPGSRVGTSSLRRRSQLLALRPDLVIENLRGNVTTRLAHLDGTRFEAIVLAAAGLKRLGLLDQRCHHLSIREVLPAVGQGAIGIECRLDDGRVRDLIAPLNCPATATCLAAERAMNRTLGGSCQVPIAGHARLDGENIALDGLVASIDGVEVVRQTAHGLASQASSIGRQVGAALLAQGADRILKSLTQI